MKPQPAASVGAGCGNAYGWGAGCGNAYGWGCVSSMNV